MLHKSYKNPESQAIVHKTDNKVLRGLPIRAINTKYTQKKQVISS